jgi:hypothetical protein
MKRLLRLNGDQSTDPKDQSLATTKCDDQSTNPKDQSITPTKQIIDSLSSDITIPKRRSHEEIVSLLDIPVPEDTPTLENCITRLLDPPVSL